MTQDHHARPGGRPAPARLPTYDELPVRPDAPAGSTWGLFGDDDEVGAINRLDESSVRHAATLVRRGAVFSLNWALELPDPPILGRGAYVRHQILQRAGTDEKLDNFHPQASTQWDALKHAKHPELGYYNGRSVDEVEAESAAVLGIDAWARRGIAGRFVLLDLARHADDTDAPSRAYGVDDLEAVLAAEGAELSAGTILLLRTGWMARYLASTPDRRAADAAAGEDIAAPGLAPGEDTARWLWDRGVVAVAADAPALEAVPFDQSTVDGFLHYRLIALLGMAIGELFDLEALAEDCARDGIYEGLLTAAPLNIAGGSGSPANALAIK